MLSYILFCSWILQGTEIGKDGKMERLLAHAQNPAQGLQKIRSSMFERANLVKKAARAGSKVTFNITIPSARFVQLALFLSHILYTILQYATNTL